MKKESIFFTITIGFIISISLVILSFLVLSSISHKSDKKKYFDKYYPIAKMVLKHEGIVLTSEVLENLNEMKYTVITNKGAINAILRNQKTEILTESGMRMHRMFFRVLNLKNNFYLHIKKNNSAILIKDNNISYDNSKTYMLLIFIVLAVVVCMVYFITFKKLLPLKILKERVITFGEENFDFEYDTSAKDEISLLGIEFKKSAQKLKKIKEARNVFIRNIMHELKTPISKGRFLTQLPNTEENNIKMQNVFIKLENLINEFSSVEEVISSSKNPKKANYFLNDIVDNAIDILLLDENAVYAEFENIKLFVNFKLFSIAVKNLIDNAIKYSNDKKVVIKTNSKEILFENAGSPLQHKLENYFEPFFANNVNDKDSFGLGLYIVNSILSANSYKLNYKHKNGINIFCICPQENNDL